MVIQQFFEIQDKFPRIIVSDQDPSIMTVIEKEYLKKGKIFHHFHCSWHPKQNLKRNCSYLSAMKLGDIKERILKLPDIKDANYFEKKVKHILELLKNKNLNKTLDYLKFQLKHKEKKGQSISSFGVYWRH